MLWTCHTLGDVLIFATGLTRLVGGGSLSESCLWAQVWLSQWGFRWLGVGRRSWCLKQHICSAEHSAIPWISFVFWCYSKEILTWSIRVTKPMRMLALERFMVMGQGAMACVMGKQVSTGIAIRRAMLRWQAYRQLCPCQNRISTTISKRRRTRPICKRGLRQGRDYWLLWRVLISTRKRNRISRQIDHTTKTS